MRDFKVLFLSDCNASFTREEQEATLNNFDKHFGVVMDSQTLMAKWADKDNRSDRSNGIFWVQTVQAVQTA
jgi:isochorismate hydrolase